MTLHQAGRLADAEAAYRKLLAARPDHADALNFLGMLCAQTGRLDEAAALLSESTRLAPAYADAHNNLGNVLKLRSDLPAARASYERALALAPGLPSAMQNLAFVLNATGLREAARPLYLQLMSRPLVQLTRSQILGFASYVFSGINEPEDVVLLVKALELLMQREPDDDEPMLLLARVFLVTRQREAACELYRAWLRRFPGHPTATHMLAASGGAEAPGRADDDYVRQTFDRFADSFDEQLVNRLGYIAPQRLHAAICRALGPDAAALDVLDAGCGTGLCGPLFRPLARKLVGVDLSEKMVDKARDPARGYDALHVGDLVGFLDQSAQDWDLLLSADTLVYFGDLNPVFAAAARCLRPGGCLGFTLEALPDDAAVEVELDLSGRYRHRRDAVVSLLTRHGFALVSFDADSLRSEAGEPVSGWVVVARSRQPPRFPDP